MATVNIVDTRNDGQINEREREDDEMDSFCNSRLALEQYQYSPLIDLEKNDETGLIRLTDHLRYGDVDSAKRVKRLQDHLNRSFQSRHEDKDEKPIATVNTTIKSSRPIVSSKDVFRPTDDLLFHHYTSSIEDIHSESRLRPLKKTFDNLAYACWVSSVVPSAFFLSDE